MILKGTTKLERIQSAIAFDKEHRTGEYDREKTAEIYRAAGVPFTDAAEKFCREWHGVWDDIVLYPEKPNAKDGDGKDVLKPIRFSMSLMDKADNLRSWYEPTAYPEYDDNCADVPGMLRAKYGAEAVPVAAGEFFYPCTIYVLPDGCICQGKVDRKKDS